ncbi:MULTISPECIES: helix-turn-helix domain-containing protein [unclassified Streptococcus]|uniref:helix-turn-helix domain-containing protein n=1 Tax=unclassified Streptococcus TaxID=2608887 RepID=UPI00359D1009
MENKIKDLRKEKGLTQQELAEEIGVSKLTILRWEQGQRDIKSDKAQQLADYFGVQVSYLLGHSGFRTWSEEDFFYTTGYPMVMPDLNDASDNDEKNSEQSFDDYLSKYNTVISKLSKLKDDDFDLISKLIDRMHKKD